MFTVLESVRVALIGLLSNRLRSFLTMIGITIGVAAVIILVSLGQAVQQYVRNQVLSLGSNLIVAFPSSNEDGTFDEFTATTVEALSGRLLGAGVSIIMPQFNSNQPVVYEGRETNVQVQGVTTEFPTLRARSVVSGRFFTAEEAATAARVAVIGQETAENLFGTTAAVGRSVRVGATRFQIIGVLNAVGSGDPGGNDDDMMVVPLLTAQRRLGGERTLRGELPVSIIMMQASDADTAASTVTQIETILREVHEVGVDEDNNFSVLSQQSILDTLGAITGILTLFLGVIAGISLLVGGIGVMNIMLVTVTERTREIGLRKAVGAQNRDIVLQFLIESTVLALVGGGVGIAIALGLTALVTALVEAFPLSVQVSSVLLATGISAGIGIFFGIYPARRAAGLNPIDALRYE